MRPSVTIPNVAQTFAWDQPSSWQQVLPSFKLDQTEQVVAGRPPLLASLQEEKYWKGPAELSAEVRLASNPDDLLIYAEVQDANLKVPQVWPGVGGSCIELFLDGRSSEAGLGHSAYASGVHQLLVKPVESAQGPADVSDASGKWGKLEGVSAIGGRITADKYWMAIQIPWKSLNPARKPDQPFGFDFGVDGPTKDGAGRKSQLMLFGTGANNIDASNFGSIRIAAGTAKLGGPMKFVPLSFPALNKKRRAFSLVEVTMALGLVSFAVITVIGLMPVGIAALHRAIDTTEEAQIVRQIGAQVLLTPYSQLPANFSGTTFYYDQDGVFLTNSAAPRPADTRYWATTTISTPVYPGSGGVASVSGSLSTVHLALMSGASVNATSTNFYNFQVPNSGN